MSEFEFPPTPGTPGTEHPQGATRPEAVPAAGAGADVGAAAPTEPVQTPPTWPYGAAPVTPSPLVPTTPIAQPPMAQLGAPGESEAPGYPAHPVYPAQSGAPAYPAYPAQPGYVPTPPYGTPPGAEWGAHPTVPGQPAAFGQPGQPEWHTGQWHGGPWVPPVAGAGAAWGTGVPNSPWGPPVAPTATPAPKKHGRTLLAVGLSAAVVAMLAGLGIGHAVWGQHTPSSLSASGSSGASGSGGSGGAGSGGSGGFGSGGFGSGGFGSGGFGSGGFGSGGTGSGGTFSVPGATSPSTVPAAAAAVATKVDPALVDINTTLSYQQSAAAGTGIVLSSSGLVLTNNHVINGATTISATDIGNGKTYTATVIGYDRTQDIAVLQLQGASNLHAADIGDSKSLKTGQSIIAIGNAGGAGGTPSVVTGSVTALNRNITASDDGGGDQEQLTGLVQTNANIQPGDSGGPLVDQSGRVLGIDTAASDNYSFQSSATQGYSIPIDTALGIEHQIDAHQATSVIHIGATGFIGIEVESPSDAQSSGTCTESSSAATGATVIGLVSGSPSGAAGLQRCDTIVSVNGKAIGTPNALTTELLNFHPGDSIQVTYTDSSGQQHTTNVQLSTGPAE